MDAYEQINPKRLKRVLIAVLIGFFLSLGLGFLLFIALVPLPIWQPYFNQLIDTLKINPFVAYTLGSGLYSLNAASPFFLEIFGSIPQFEAGIRAAILPAILTWFLTGLVMGLLAKRWDDGFLSGLLCGLVVWAFTIIATRFVILGTSQLGIFTIAELLMYFLSLVNSSAAIIICMAGGVVGGLLYSKILFRKQALIEQYM